MQQIRKLNRFDVATDKKGELLEKSHNLNEAAKSEESSEETPSESVSATSSLRIGKDLIP
jgi:hypothetical protein